MRQGDHAAYAAAIVLYIAIGVLAIVPRQVLRIEGVLLTLLVFLGFNVAWRLMYAVRAVGAGDAHQHSRAPG